MNALSQSRLHVSNLADSKRLLRGVLCLQCVHVTRTEQRTAIFTISELNKEEDNYLNMLPVNVKIWEHTLVTAIILLVKRRNYDSPRRFMCTYKILLE